MKVDARIAQGTVLVALAAAVYLNTLPNGFVVDDVPQIVENDWITGTRYLQEIFGQGVWDFEGRTSSYYRPMMYLLYMGVYAVAGRAPWAYHLLSLLFHAGATLLVFMLLRQILPRGEARAPAWLAPAFVAGLLFAVHPIHTEPVAWSAGIPDLGFAVFGLISLWCHVTAMERGWPRDVLAAVAWLLALLCKETAVVIPVIAAAYDGIFVVPEKRSERLVKGLLPFAAVAAVYVGLRVHALGGLMPNAGGAGLGVSAYALSVVALLGRYLEKLVLPLSLNFWPSFVPPASLLSLEALRAFAVVSAAGAATYAAWGHRPARFAVLLVVLPLLPSFHLGALNQGLENAFAERYLYLPSVGFVLLVALAVDVLRARERLRPAQALAAVLVLGAAYAAATTVRNPVWKDHLTLWSDAVGKAPGNAVGRMNYGAALIYGGREDEGAAEMREAAAMQPGLVDRQLANAAAYLSKGLQKKAILALHTVLVLDPKHAPAHYNLGLVYESQGQPGAATSEYQKALALNPSYSEAHNNLGILYAEQGRMDMALRHFREAVRLRPSDPEYRTNLERAERR